MGFIMDGLDAEAYDRTYSDWQLVRRIFAYFRPQARRMMLVVAGLVLYSAVTTLTPIYLSRTLDRAQLDPSSFDWRVSALIIMALGAVSWTLNAIQRWNMFTAIGEVVLKIRRDAFDAVTQRDLSFYDQYASGRIVSRVTSDTQAFSSTVELTTNLLSQVALIVFLLAYLFSVNVTLSLVTLSITPFIVGVALGFRVLARRTITATRRIMATVNAHVQETVSGIGVAKSFRREAMIYEEFLAVNKQAFWVQLRTGFTFAGIFPILITIAGLGTGLLVLVGVGMAQNQVLTAGEWYLFIQGLELFWFPLTSIASFWSQFQLGLAAGERVFALLDADSKVQQSGENLQPDSFSGQIEFKHMNFQYKEDEPVLRDFSLTIGAGETLALVGHTGSGKSSIGKLIARFYEYQEGQLSIDGYNIRDLDLEHYRSVLGVVTQTPFLFEGTVMDNIRYGRQDFTEDVSHADGYLPGVNSATDEEVIAVAERIAGGDWLKFLPDGLQTQVGERGSNLSIGQRQLVALARVVLQDPRILILDEATASVDPLTEALIQEGLETVLQGRTAIVIAHRLSTIKSADRIIVLNQGRILEEGTHDSLMVSGGHYAELYNTYFRHQSLEYIENAETLLVV